jgi:hypothetical protein
MISNAWGETLVSPRNGFSVDATKLIRAARKKAMTPPRNTWLKSFISSNQIKSILIPTPMITMYQRIGGRPDATALCRFRRASIKALNCRRVSVTEPVKLELSEPESLRA